MYECMCGLCERQALQSPTYHKALNSCLECCMLGLEGSRVCGSCVGAPVHSPGPAGAWSTLACTLVYCACTKNYTSKMRVQLARNWCVAVRAPPAPWAIALFIF